MTERFEWTFPSAAKCEIKGLNDSGVETFRGDTISSLAREICQNSLDAAIPQPGGIDSGPVEVEFALFRMATADFPARDEFARAIELSADFWRENEQASSFFAELRPVLAARTLTCLRISDSNTTGLTGVHETDLTRGSAWRSLVMSSGVSDKTDASGGSFGIGKYASFSCSKFRTVFYSTQTSDGKSGFQGVSRLVTFKNEDDEFALGTGYLGGPDASPIADWVTLDSAYQRRCPGTDIFIPAFVGGTDFRADIVKSVLEGFLYAIWTRRLVVKVDDGDILTVLDRAWLERAYRSEDELLAAVRRSYEAIRQPSEKWREKDYGARGKVRLSLLTTAKDLDKRIAMIRYPGMQIFKKDHFRSHVSFTGVLIVEGDLNRELKKFENPQHTRWEEKRDPEHVSLLKEIYDFCRDAVSEIVKENLGEEIDSGLGDVLPDSGSEGDPRTEETLDVKIKGVVMEKAPVRHKRRGGKTTRGGTVTGHESGSDKHETNKPKPTAHDQGGGGAKKVLRREIGHAAFRSVCRDKTRGAYKLKIIPEKSAEKGAVDVIAVAEIKDYAAPVRSARLSDGTPLTVAGGEISGFAFRKNEPVTIELTLDYTDYVSLEVACYEYK